jgi:hypothetical protein
MRVYSIKAEEFRKLDNPHGPSDKYKYVCYVHVDQVPDDIPMATNPRDQKRTPFDENTKKYFWRKNPFKAYQKHRQNIATQMIDYINDIGNNPNAAGKNLNGLDYIYMTTERALND